MYIPRPIASVSQCVHWTYTAVYTGVLQKLCIHCSGSSVAISVPQCAMAVYVRCALATLSLGLGIYINRASLEMLTRELGQYSDTETTMLHVETTYCPQGQVIICHGIIFYENYFTDQ